MVVVGRPGGCIDPDGCGVVIVGVPPDDRTTWNEKHLDASQSSVLTPTGYKLHFVTTRSTASMATTAKVAKEVGSPIYLCIVFFV